MNALALTHLTATSCLGAGLDATWAAIEQQRSGLAPCRFETARLSTYVGEVAGLEQYRLPGALQAFDCRNNRLAQMGLSQDGFDAAVAQCAARLGAHRIGVFIGTSTSGVLSTEIAYRHRDAAGALRASFDYQRSHNSFSVADYVRHALQLRGPAVAVCTACSSSAKVFAAAMRMLESEQIDAAVVGGVDSLCLTTLYGFHSLQLTSTRPCRPFDAERDGLSIAEAAAFALLERPSAANRSGVVHLLGVGESSDAHHMSSPHPKGEGARQAMQQALSCARLPASAIDYINLHGTGTPSNDSAESLAVSALFARATPASSTKGATGHTLGAAGALEAVICALALQRQLMPGGLNVTQVDPRLGIHYLINNRRQPLQHVLSNSFGFGGANCALLFGRAA